MRCGVDVCAYHSYKSQGTTPPHEHHLQGSTSPVNVEPPGHSDPRIVQLNPSWLAKHSLLQNFDDWCFFILGRDLICVAMEHFYCQQQRWYMYFQYSWRIGFKGFGSFQKSFLALFWHGRKVLHVSSHSLLWQLHLMSTKWSEKHPLLWVASWWQGEVILEWEQWSHAHICWGGIPACLVCFRQLNAWLRSQIRAADPPTSPFVKQQGEDSAELPGSAAAAKSLHRSFQIFQVPALLKTIILANLTYL